MSSIFLMSHDLSQPIRTGSEKAQKQMLQQKKVFLKIILENKNNLSNTEIEIKIGAATSCLTSCSKTNC